MECGKFKYHSILTSSNNIFGPSKGLNEFEPCGKCVNRHHGYVSTHLPSQFRHTVLDLRVVLDPYTQHTHKHEH